MAKKKGFFNAVARAVTGKTAEQRKKDSLANAKIKMLEEEAYRKERIAQAGNVGRAKAKFVAKQRIKALTTPKKAGSGGLNLGNFGKLQKGFDPMTFGSSSGAFGSKAKTSHVLSPMQVANMKFTDYTKPTIKTKVKARIKRKRRKKKK